MKSEHSIRICVSVCEQTTNALQQSLKRAASAGDLIEVRADCLSQLQTSKSFEELEATVSQSGKPVVLTYRPVEQGGRRALDPRRRLFFWLFKRPRTAEFFDIELDIVRNEPLFSKENPLDWTRVICSHHNFSGMSVDLNRIYDSMKDTRASILKIAVRVTDAVDCLEFFRLLERARNDRRELIAVAMGPAGVMTRILGPSQGAFLTYAALEDDTATAPGQITAAELRDLYRIQKIGRQTQIMGVVGNPVHHSLSPHMHNAAFEAAGIDAVYIPFEVRDVDAFMKRMVHPLTREFDLGFRGLSVTAPHKAAMAVCLDWIDPAAEEIGAVNTVIVERDKLRGYNTDAKALVEPLLVKAGELQHRRCAIIGAGGAAAAAVWGLRSKGAEAILFARDPERGRTLAERFRVKLEDLHNARFEGFDIVINATPLGTAGELQNESPVLSEQLCGALLAYDLVYNPTETRFLREARAAGCETLGGLAMLVGQAVAQFELWTGIPAPGEVMANAAARTLASAVSPK